MSTDDQDAIIVRLLRELAVAKKELALVREQLRSLARAWSGLPQAFEKAAKGDSSEARRAVAELLDPAGLQQTRALLDDLERLPARIEEIRATLKDAGIEA